MIKMYNCQYCDEFESGSLEVRGQSLGNRVLFESDNFLVFPSLGQIVEGYLLIATKRHYIGLGEIPSELHQELEEVQEKVRTVLTNNYGTPLFFEHGPTSRSKKGGCCIEHAHIHAVPLQVDILDDITENFTYRKINDFNELKKQFARGVPYFFFEDNNRDRYLFEIPDVVPSQYIRQIIAHKIGKPERWDWRSCLGLEELTRTLKKLRDKFE